MLENNEPQEKPADQDVDLHTRVSSLLFRGVGINYNNGTIWFDVDKKTGKPHLTGTSGINKIYEGSEFIKGARRNLYDAIIEVAFEKFVNDLKNLGIEIDC